MIYNTLKEIAPIFGVSYPTVRGWVKQGFIVYDEEEFGYRFRTMSEMHKIFGDSVSPYFKKFTKERVFSIGY